MFKLFYWGVLARFINTFVKVESKHWVFAADFGNTYREGSKYLQLYMLKEHPDYECTFITRNKEVVKDLTSKGIPCMYNFSLKGIIEIAKSEAVFTTQVISDIRFAYKKTNRKFYYLVHGMPYKKAMAMLPKNYISNIRKLSTGKKIVNKISYYLTLGYTMSDVSFVSACSDFLAQYQSKEFPNCDTKVLGMPRNDALFNHQMMSKERWIEGLDEKFVITYMPTHRGYGTGKLSPSPFESRSDIQQWMRENNVVLLVKNHPNMIEKLADKKDTVVLRDITKLGLDPQVCIYHSDVLITDYSSVWMDYLILQRPLIFYWYDDFENNDVGSYYDLRAIKPGMFCYDEDELFETIKKIKMNYNNMRPSADVISKYHKYIDGNSCNRYFEAVNLDLRKNKNE